MNPLLQNISSRLEKLRRDYLLWQTVLTLIYGGSILLTFIAFFIVSDWLLIYPAWACWLARLAMILILIRAAVLVYRLHHPRITLPALAILAEKTWPDSENRLINVLQLSSTGAESTAEKILQEKPIPYDRIRLLNILPPNRITLFMAPFIASVLVLAGLFLFAPDATGKAISRLISPSESATVYSLTRIVNVKPGHVKTERHSSLSVKAEMQGLIPDSASIIWDRGGKKPKKIAMIRDSETNNIFQVELPGIMASSRYRIAAGDGESAWYRINIRQPPNLKHWEASISPPDYTQTPDFKLDLDSRSMNIPADSQVELSTEFTGPVNELTLKQASEIIHKEKSPDKLKTNFYSNFQFTSDNTESIEIEIKAPGETTSSELLPWRIIPDKPPQVRFIKPAQNLEIKNDEMLPITFKAEDDYGIRQVVLERESPKGEGENQTLGVAPVNPSRPVFHGRFILDAASLNLKPGGTANLQLKAKDNCPFHPERWGKSGIINLTITDPRGQEKVPAAERKQLKSDLQQILLWQRNNLRKTIAMRDLASTGGRPGSTTLKDALDKQLEIYNKAEELIDSEATPKETRLRLIGLFENEMADATEILAKSVHSGTDKEISGIGEQLTTVTRLQRKILATLTGLIENLEAEYKHQQRVDILSRLRKLTEGQKLNLKASLELKNQPDTDTPQRLAMVQDRLTNDLNSFTSLARNLGQIHAEDGFLNNLGNTLKLFRENKLYETMITAAEALHHEEIKSGIKKEREALATLAQGLNILNNWRAELAREKITKASELIDDIDEELRNLEERQAEIVERTRELAKRGPLDEETRGILADMDIEQEEMGKLIESLAQDLYQFPELPVANELNSRMLEIFEDVQQAAGSENEQAFEVAVQKEETLLDSIRETKERVEDVEMWLPDTPDNIVWNMESFDIDELSEIPLVPLPDELEDIVGELLDQSPEIDFQAQDTTGNQLISDIQMGWDIMDGPMPSFSAKGKSGNMRPNENEMTGRSGAGREGQAVGELVEDHVKGLEGRETTLRRTRDPFQEGMVTEDDDSTLTARATGGGKSGGQSETAGMFGQAPRRDLHLPPSHKSRTRLRRKTEAVYTAARLLYLPTGGLGLAAADLRRSIKETPNLPDNPNHRRAIRRLADAPFEIRDEVILHLPSRRSAGLGGTDIQDFDLEDIEPESRQLIMEYYKKTISNK